MDTYHIDTLVETVNTIVATTEDGMPEHLTRCNAETIMKQSVTLLQFIQQQFPDAMEDAMKELSTGGSNNESVLVRFYSGKKCEREMEIHCNSMTDALLTKLAFTMLFAVPIAENEVSVMIAEKLDV